MKNKEIIIGGISKKELILFVRQLHATVHSGYKLKQGLEIARDQSKGRLKQVLNVMIEDVEHGAYFHEALEKHKRYFPPLFISLIKTGELSGSLEENLKRLVDVTRKDYEFKQKVRSAMTYPTFVFLAVFILGMSVSIFVLPNLLPLFKSLDIDLPISTRVLLWFAELFEAHGTQVFWGMIFSVGVLIWLFRQAFFRPVSHWLILHIPFLRSFSRQITMARFGRSLASMLRSGIPIDQSLEILNTVITNLYYQRVILKIIPQIQKGETLSDALKRHNGLFDDIFVKFLALGETTAGLEESCDNVAEYYESEVDESMRNLSVSLEPILLLAVGLIVAFVAISILGPIYKITGSVR